MIRTLSVLLILSALAPAQQDPPLSPWLAGQELVTVRATKLSVLAKQLEGTQFGRFCTEGPGKVMLERVFAQLRSQSEARDAAVRDAVDCGAPVDGWVLNNLFASPDLEAVLSRDLAEYEGFELHAALPEDVGENGFRTPNSAVVLRCRPKFEGRWTRDFEDRAALLRRSNWFDEQANAKIAGFPAYMFVPKARERDPQAPISMSFGNVWMQHMPGAFVTGSGDVRKGSDVAVIDQAEVPGLAMEMQLQAYLKLFPFAGGAGGMPQEFKVLGFDNLKRLRWSGVVAEELLLDEIMVELTDAKPTGLVGVLLNGTAKLPPQPLPEGAMLQLRAAIDIDELFSTLDGLGAAPGGEIEKLARKALDGGVSLGVCAPQKGGALPRMFGTFGIADREAMDGIMAALPKMGMKTRVRTYEGVECTSLILEGVPQGIQPTWCLADGYLHVAESPRSMRTYLKTRAKGGEAMDVGDAPWPGGSGERLPQLELRLDEVAAYRAFRTIWLPMFELVSDDKTAVTSDDMSDVEEFARFAGKSRGGLYRDGNRYYLRHLGAFGGPQSLALAVTYPSILSGMGSDYVTDQIRGAVAKHKLGHLAEAIAAFERENSRRPKDLAELVVAQRLEDDALWLRGDAKAEPVKLAGERTVRTSFRYFPKGVKVDQHGTEFEACLVQIAPGRWERYALSTGGQVLTLHEGSGAFQFELK